MVRVVMKPVKPDGTQTAPTLGAGSWGSGASPPRPPARFRPRPRPQPAARFLPPARPRPASFPARAPRRPRATQSCPPVGSGAAFCPGSRSPRPGRPDRAPAPCPTGGPASCAARARAPAPPTPRAVRTFGPCAAQPGAARCPGTQATPSECPPQATPAPEPRPGPLPSPPGALGCLNPG